MSVGFEDITGRNTKLTKRIKVGIIGAGGMAAYHIPGFRQGGADVVAIADPNLAAAERCARKHGVPRTYASTDEMMAKERLDAVSVITPNRFHAPLAIAALRAGLHVFCEKPPALNAREAMAMAKAAEKAGKRLMFDFCNRARPESQAIRREAETGRLGHVNSAQATWIRRTGIPGFGGWFTTRALSGGGPVIDLLHGIDLSLWFMGHPEPDYVLARTFDDFIRDRRFRGPWGIPERNDGTCDVEAAAHGFVTFKDGSCLIIRNSWAEMVKREEMSVTLQGTKEGVMLRRLFGEDGIDSTAEDVCEIYRVTGKGDRKDGSLTDRRDETMGRLRCAANFIRTLQGREKPMSTPSEAVKLMKIVDAVYKSAKTGCPVKVK